MVGNRMVSNHHVAVDITNDLQHCVDDLWTESLQPLGNYL